MELEVARRSRDRDWALLSDGWKTLSVNPAVNGYLLELGKGAKGDGGAPHSSA